MDGKEALFPAYYESLLGPFFTTFLSRSRILSSMWVFQSFTQCYIAGRRRESIYYYLFMEVDGRLSGGRQNQAKCAKMEERRHRKMNVTTNRDPVTVSRRSYFCRVANDIIFYCAPTESSGPCVSISSHVRHDRQQ